MVESRRTVTMARGPVPCRTATVSALGRSTGLSFMTFLAVVRRLCGCLATLRGNDRHLASVPGAAAAGPSGTGDREGSDQVSSARATKRAARGEPHPVLGGRVEQGWDRRDRTGDGGKWVII